MRIIDTIREMSDREFNGFAVVFGVTAFLLILLVLTVFV